MTPADVLLVINAYHRRERASYWRSGLITSAIINMNRQKGSQPAKPEDFVPQVRRQNEQSPEQMAAILKAFTLASGGDVQC